MADPDAAPEPRPPRPEITPAELRALLARVAELTIALDGLDARLMPAVDDPTRAIRFSIEDAADFVRAALPLLHDAVNNLARIRSRGTCTADWGLCPDHGSTLSGSGGRSWCHVEGCGQEWDYDRGGLPCMENATFEVIDPAGATHYMCPGHATEARIYHAVVTPLDPDAT